MRQVILVFLCATALASTDIKPEEKSAELFQSIFDEDNSSLTDHINEYFKRSDYSFKLPVLGSTVVLDARNLENNELKLKLDFSSEDVQARKKSKIKKVFVPILVFILLKALVLVPLALGILGIKTWNAIQLSFISFVSALVLAVWKLCSKMNHDHPPAIIHNSWDPYHHDRSDSPQAMAYSNYIPS